MSKKAWKWIFVVWIAVLLSAVPASGEEANPAAPGQDGLLRLHQINIGCADAYLLTVDHTVILVDCGSDTTAPISAGYHNYPLFEYLEASGIDHVDAHIVTHWHNDHDYNVNAIGALYYTADTVVYGPSPELYQPLQPLAAGTYRQMKEGDRLAIGPLSLLCVSPEYKEVIPGDRNVDSLNFILTFGRIRIMFTGDYLQWSLSRRWGDEIRDVDIMSFPHHGIRTDEVPPAVYRLINPRLILIPGQAYGAARSLAIHQSYVGKDAVYLCAGHGHILCTTDGSSVWYAAGVSPGTFPLGEALPPRED